MIRRPPRSTRTDTLFPYTTLFRAGKAESLRATAKDAPKQFEAYKSDCIEALNPFEPGKSLDSATSAHDFDFKILKHEPTTVYLMAPSEKLAVAAPWISLIISHIIETVAREEIGRAHV